MRLRIFLPLLALAASGAAQADSLDINLNNDTIQATYATDWRSAQFNLGALSNSNTHDWVASAGLLALGARETNENRTEVGIGGKLYVVSVGDSNLQALGLGGNFLVFPGNGPLGVGGYAFYAPDVVTTGDGKKFWETGAHIDYEVIKHTADVYLGYRRIRAELTNGSRVTVDSGGDVGIRIRF